MIERTLERELQWLVFEPNGDSLRAEVRHLVTAYLRRLFRAGSFAGATEEQSFFVRCDEQLNPQSVVDEGRLVAEIGIAPVEPVEFIVVRITRDGDGTLLVEGSGG
jgi:phage tail sheath protein FI